MPAEPEKNVDHEGETNEEEAEPELDKHNWGAADLVKVGQMEEDDREVRGNLEQFMNHSVRSKATIKLKQEDIQTLIQELELPRATAEQELRNNDGDLVKTICSIVGMSGDLAAKISP